MTNNAQETEAKFYVRDLKKIETLLQDSGAHSVQSRVLERNIRFDLPDARLRSERRVLRLRRDTESRLTYKSASTNDHGVLSRTEIEFIVEDFEKAKQFLEALGYQSIFYYEKYRTTYALQPSEGLEPSEGLTHIMLDELPYGNFVEIEGETVESIQSVSVTLNLDWDTAVATSYFALFERARQSLDLSLQDLSFENFAGIHVTPAHLSVRAADDIT
jgi:adenylate cyclase class 2